MPIQNISPTLPLSVREEQVLDHLRAGRTTAKAMAHAMNLSPHTVEVYRRNVLIKFGCRNVTELAFKMIQCQDDPRAGCFCGRSQ